MSESESRNVPTISPQVFHILLSLVDNDLHGYAIIQEVAARPDGNVVEELAGGVGIRRHGGAGLDDGDRVLADATRGAHGRSQLPRTDPPVHACHVIVPAATGAQADLQTADGPEEMVQKVQDLADTIEHQGAATGDSAFAQDTAGLADQYRALLASARSGKVPDFSALQKAAEQVGYDCGKAGVTS